MSSELEPDELLLDESVDELLDESLEDSEELSLDESLEESLEDSELESVDESDEESLDESELDSDDEPVLELSELELSELELFEPELFDEVEPVLLEEPPLPPEGVLSSSELEGLDEVSPVSGVELSSGVETLELVLPVLELSDEPSALSLEGWLLSAGCEADTLVSTSEPVPLSLLSIVNAM